MWTYARWRRLEGPYDPRWLATGGPDDAAPRHGEEAVEERLTVRQGAQLGEDLARDGPQQQGPGRDPLGQGDGVEVGRGEHRGLQQPPDAGLRAPGDHSEAVLVGEATCAAH